MVGRSLGHYRVVRELGAGGLGRSRVLGEREEREGEE